MKHWNWKPSWITCTIQRILDLDLLLWELCLLIFSKRLIQKNFLRKPKVYHTLPPPFFFVFWKKKEREKDRNVFVDFESLKVRDRAKEKENLNKGSKQTKNKLGVLHYAKKPLLLISFGLLIAISVRLPENLPTVLQLIITAAARQAISIAIASIIFSAICPETHPLHSPWLKWFMSFKFWFPLANLSFGMYLVHFRIQLELLMRLIRPQSPEEVSFNHVVLLYVLSAFLGYLSALLLHFFVDAPAARLKKPLLARLSHLKADWRN